MSKEMLLDYRPIDLFNLVLDVERYHEFLPWCEAVRIIERGDGYFVADLLAEFHIFSESYRSRVEYKEVESTYIIDILLESGSLKKLHNHWIFSERIVNDKHDAQTLLTFNIDFAFKSTLLNKVAEKALITVSHKMIDAFVERAKQLY